MKKRCADFPKFTEISGELRKYKRTKAWYSTRKAMPLLLATVMVLRVRELIKELNAVEKV